MNHSGPNKTLRSLGRSVLFMVLLAAALSCGPKPTGPEELARDREILATCPKDVKLAAKIDLDVSGSSRTTELGPEPTRIIETVARRTAICRGHLKVTAFSSTSAATYVLYDGELVLPGATDNARLRRTQKLVDEVLQHITSVHGTGVRTLSPSRSDILGQYRLASEYLIQLGQGYRLELVIVTDGIHTADLRIGSASLTPAKAKALAAKVNVPRLSAASITVTGLGKVTNGQPVSSRIVEGLVTFYKAVCVRTGAADCKAVTDFAAAGR